MPGNIATVPPEVVAQWPEPNYVDPVTREWLPAHTVMLLFLSTVFVVIRLVLRWRRVGGKFGLDDYFLVPSWLLAIVFTVLACYSNTHGMTDRHIWDLKPGKLHKDIENAWAAQFVFVTGTSLLKISVLFFYRRMVAGTFNKYWKYATWAAIAFTAAYLVAFDLALIFNCRPTRAYWMAYDPEWEARVHYHCADTRLINPIAGGVSVFSDVYAIVLPCIMVQRLEMTRRQKLSLNAVFATGIVVVAAAGMRTWYSMTPPDKLFSREHVADPSKVIRFGTEADITWIGFELYFWTALEYQLGIACACAPSLRVFFQKFLRPRLSEVKSRHSHGRHTTHSTRDGRPTTPNTMEHPLQPMGSKRCSFEPSMLSSQDSQGQRPTTKPADTLHEIDEVEMGCSPNKRGSKNIEREVYELQGSDDGRGLERADSGLQPEAHASPLSTRQW